MQLLLILFNWKPIRLQTLLIKLFERIVPGPWTLVLLIAGLLFILVVRAIILSFTGTKF